MNWSGISGQTLLGKLLRLPLKALPATMRMPILQGRLRGKRWIVGASNHGCWVGSYEYDRQQLFERTLTPGSVVYDLGGHVGFYTLLASELVGPSGKVFVFEPLPRNLYFLKEHLRLNNVRNVTVIEAAVSDKSGEIRFQEGGASSMGHIAEDGTIRVKTVALDELIAAGEIPPPDFIKMDIEGAEAQALVGAKSLLSTARPILFLSTHEPVTHRASYEFLQSLGYQIQPTDGVRVEESREMLVTFP